MIKKINKILNKVENVLLRNYVFSLPRYAQIEPTNLCNQKCKMCPRNTHLDVSHNTMKLDDFKKIINQIPSIENLSLSGLGEPLFCHDLFEMIKFAKSRGIITSTTSNCGIMTKEKAEALIMSGLDHFKISLDSLNPSIYHSIRQAELVPSLQGIRDFMEVKNNLKSKSPSVWFNSIIMKDNYKDLIDILKLGEELKVNFIRFKPINVFDLYEDKNLKVDNNELSKNIESVLEQAKNLKVNHNLLKVLENLKGDKYYRSFLKIPCYTPWNEIYIQQYGGARLCCEFYSKKYDIGNIFEEDFKKIWNGVKMKKIRSEFKKGNTFFPVCKNCNRFQKNINLWNRINKVKNKFGIR